jgi:uncharacterized protein YcbX
MEAVMTVVGRVAGLWRYPVKSMAAEELDGAEVSWHGLAGDPPLGVHPRRAGAQRLSMADDRRTTRDGLLPAPLRRTGPAQRFRPNILVDAPGCEFPEDAWVGRVLRIGGLRMRVDKRDQRCVIVTIDPVTLARDPAILRAVARERGARFGVYGSTVEPGEVRVGDSVELEP